MTRETSQKRRNQDRQMAVVCHGTWSHEPATMKTIEGGSVQCPVCNIVVDIEDRSGWERDDERTDGGRTKRHGREYARQQARDHRAMERRNYQRDGRTSGGRRL